MNIICCCEQDAAAYSTVLYPNHYSEAPVPNLKCDERAWGDALQERKKASPTLETEKRHPWVGRNTGHVRLT